MIKCFQSQENQFITENIIENVLTSICNDINWQLSYNMKDKIHNVFKIIDQITSEINNSRKRLISLNFIVRQLLFFFILGSPYDKINITKSKRTFNRYMQFWNKIIELKGHEIRNIINQ